MKMKFLAKSSCAYFLITLIVLLSAAPINADVLVVAQMDDSQVVLVESETYKTLATLDTGKNPHEVRVSPDQRYAYIAAGKTITAIDLKQRKVKANFDLGQHSAHDIRVSRDGRLLWLACARTESILELDANTGQVLKTYNQPAGLVVC
jgi:DNA-binding beta-propeller fold protein YncE